MGKKTLPIVYNTEREKLIIPEYGRYIQTLVNQLLEVSDRSERNKKAEYLISVLEGMSLKQKNSEELQNKLWDQLFIMSRFRLDVDSPYPRPSQENFEQDPEKLDYPQKNKKYRYYGSIIQKMIERLDTIEEGEDKDGLKLHLANIMKKSYYLWNKEVIEDTVIFEHLNKISEGKTFIESGQLSPINFNSDYPNKKKRPNVNGKLNIKNKKRRV